MPKTQELRFESESFVLTYPTTQQRAEALLSCLEKIYVSAQTSADFDQAPLHQKGVTCEHYHTIQRLIGAYYSQPESIEEEKPQPQPTKKDEFQPISEDRDFNFLCQVLFLCQKIKRKTSVFSYQINPKFTDGTHTLHISSACYSDDISTSIAIEDSINIENSLDEERERFIGKLKVFLQELEKGERND